MTLMLPILAGVLAVGAMVVVLSRMVPHPADEQGVRLLDGSEARLAGGGRRIGQDGSAVFVAGDGGAAGGACDGGGGGGGCE